MCEEDFIRSFETGTIAAKDFHHREHIKVVWLYLQRFSVLETLAKFSEGLKRFASANGKANLYHETITWAYVFLIHERISRRHGEQTWQEFIDSNADLFDWKVSILLSYYEEVTLRSDLARKTFILPDKISIRHSSSA